jgi:hypothetical protein
MAKIHTHSVYSSIAELVSHNPKVPSSNLGPATE